MTWYYNKKTIDRDSEELAGMKGFVYLITNLKSGKKYVGKKVIWTTEKRPPLKGRVRKRVIEVWTDWEDYWSSCEPLLDDIEKLGHKHFKREILSLHQNKTEINYAELCEQITRNVLDARSPNGEKVYYNANIDRIYYPSEVFGEDRTDLHKFRLKRESK